ncbi:MAG TPA: M23 family metallopeptidase [Candidatus Mcinerneyibacteriales bacterium]|nr:M23 family metallopeptidase [Candidatus Mcinerneyibacteriales bacterium]
MKKKSQNRSYFLFILLLLIPVSLSAQNSVRAGIPLYVQDNTLCLNRIFFRGERIEALAGGRKLPVTEDSSFFHIRLPLLVSSAKELRIITDDVSFDPLLTEEDLVLGFVQFPRECIEGVARRVEIDPPRPLEKLEVRIDGEKIPLYRGREDRVIFYLAYPVLSGKKESLITVKAVTRAGSAGRYTFAVKVNKGKYLKERLTLGAVYTGEDGLGRIRSLLLDYENKKVARLLKSKSGWLGDPPRGFDLPVGGRVTSPFGVIRSYNGRGYRTYHTGADIGGNPAGTPVTAPLGGEVLCAEDFYARGLTVILDHGCGVKSLYYHLDRLEVKTGESVSPGDVLGDVGTTGFSTGPHLHWDVRVNGIPVNPLLFPH